MRGGKPHQIQPVTLNLPHQLRPLPPKRNIPRPQSQPLPPRPGLPRPVITTATHVAEHPTSAVSPAYGGSKGWGREKCHVAFSGCAQPGQWQTRPPGARSWALSPSLTPYVGPGLSPGRVSRLTPPFFKRYFEPYLVWPLTQDQFALGDPTHGSYPPRFIGTLKPLHCDKVMVPGEAYEYHFG